MNAAVKRRLLRERVSAPPESMPWWITASLALLALLSLLAAIGAGTVYGVYAHYASQYTPIEERISQRSTGLTLVYDRGGPENGVLLGPLSNPNSQLLNPIPLENISTWMIEATISTEDNGFWSNPGVEPKSLVRAAYENYVGGGIGSGTGGSTLTQQLVKNVYLSDDCVLVDGVRSCVAPRTLSRKLKEIAFAMELERDYSKEQILGWYLNQISYADRYVGVEAAARGYFRKSAAELTLAEAATLAGIPSAPTEYHPRLNCVADETGACIADELGRTTVAGAAKQRQEYVLDLMVEHGRATREEADAAKLEPVLVYPGTNSLVASAWIDNQIEPRLARMCEGGLLPKIEGAADCTESVRNAGYKVTSTLDYAQTQQAQAMTNTFVFNGLEAGCRCHNASIVTIEPSTGQIIVYSPNIDPTWVSDPRVAGHIDQANEINQPGSSFKPLVYLTWFDVLSKTPMSSIFDTSPLVLGYPYVAQGSEPVRIVNPRPGGGGEGLITARAALGGSQNVGAFRAASEAGIDNVIAYAKRMGITTLDQNFDPTFYDHEMVTYGPAIATGGANIRVVDMAYMNATIANMGAMVGVPALAETVEKADMLSLVGAEGDDYDAAMRQKLEFQRGNIRLPGSRDLDPVTVLEVRSIDGEVLYTHGDDLQRQQVVDPGSVWMLHSIMSDCNARFIIWRCGSSNNDLSLDVFMDGVKVPTGVKTGTQQGFTSASDTLETWMNGYSRYAATAVWVGNSDNSLVNDRSFAAANTTVRLFKNWMGQYHANLRDAGVALDLSGFDANRPANVVFGKFQSATTERGARGGCRQMVDTWMRTDIEYKGDCQGLGWMPLPELAPGLAAALARSRGIPTAAGQAVSAQPAPTQAAQPVNTPRPQPTAPAPQPTQAPAQPTQPPPPPQPTQPPPQPTQPPPTQSQGQSPPTQEPDGDGDSDGPGG
jgi:membrane peptidoglycan carboxypeptidase